MRILLLTFVTVFIAEMGDKTQLLMIAMAKKFKIRDILLGVGAAIIVLNLLAVALGSVLGSALRTEWIDLVAGLAFFYFATSAILSDEDEENVKEKGKFGAIFTTFGIFFLGELGDKTQLTALTLAAGEASGGFDFSMSAMVFLGATVALMAADLIGLVVGYFLGKSIPNAVFGWISYLLFAAFGIMKLLSSFDVFFAELSNGMLLKILSTVVLTLLFFGVSMFLRFRKKKTTDARE